MTRPTFLTLLLGVLVATFAGAQEVAFQEQTVPEETEIAVAENVVVEGNVTESTAKGFYFDMNGRCELPVSVGSFGRITGVGFGASAAFGYDYYGWRYGVRYVFARNLTGSSENAYGIDIMQQLISIQIEKEIGYSIIKSFPAWLKMIPSLGLGIDLVSGSSVYRANNVRYKYSGCAFMLSAGLLCEFDVKSRIAPCAGFVMDMFFDNAGVVPYCGFLIGVHCLLPNKQVANSAS